MKKWNKFFYRNPKGSIDPDSAWKQQNEQVKNNDIYKMVDLSGGGTFIEEYNKGEDQAAKKLRIQNYFQTEIAPRCLFTNTEMISMESYQHWHNKQSSLTKKLMARKESPTHESVHITTVDNNDDGFSVVSLDTVIHPYTEHEAKWKLDHRGAIGETPIHLLFLNGTPRHIEIAKALLEIYPQLALDWYEGFEYYGETCLHFAIIQNNVDAVKVLLDTNCVDLHVQARGKFFVPVDVKRGDVKLRKHKFEGYAYYGEYPLSFAASIGNREIYDMLIKAGCDPTKSDRFKNNVLHLTVIHDQPDMYYHALKHSKRWPDPNAVNKEGLTPLALAAKLGKKDMFKKILEISSKQYWSYNTVTCSTYPLKSLDTIGPGGETDWNSALMMIIRGRKDSHLDMVSDGVIHQLLDEKWEKFGRFKFIRLTVAFVLHLICLTTAVYLRPVAQSDLRYGTSDVDITRYVFESLVILICMFVVYFAIREIQLETFDGFWQNMKSIPSRLFYLISVILLIICVPVRFTAQYNAEEWLLVFAVPGLWSYLLFFLRNWSQTGPFITMIFKITSTDIARFAFIYGIILGTSGVAFFYQFEGQNIEAFLTPPGTFMTLFQMSFGEFDYNDVLQGKYQALSILLFVIFMIMVHILLLNMLIAMITRTFDKIISRSEPVWRRQWASMVVTMERSHSLADKIMFQKSYALNMTSDRVTSEGDAVRSDGTEFKTNTPALMVIHHQQTSETQRRQLIKESWKKLGQQLLPPPGKIPQPKFQIRGISGLAEFIKDAPQEEEEQDDSLINRVRSAVSRATVSLYEDDDSDMEMDA